MYWRPVWLSHGWCHVTETVMPSRRQFQCAHHTTVHQSVSCSPSHFIQSHIAGRVRMCQFNCNLHMTFCGRMTRASFTCYCGNTGPVERIPKLTKVSTDKIWPQSSLLSCGHSFRDSNQGPFDHGSDALSPLPSVIHTWKAHGIHW